MIYKESKEHLLKQDLIKKCPIDYKAIANLIKRAYKDIQTAKRNLDIDEECAYNYAYNAMLRSGLALMFSNGFRPDVKNKHLTIIKFSSSILSNEFSQLINNYNYMRKKRNRFIYEPDIPCSMKEARDAITTAGKYVKNISKLIREKSPQKEFDFGEI